MKHEQIGARQRVNLLIDRETVEAARELGLNLSRTVEQALAREIKIAREQRWRDNNLEAIASSNAWFEERGIPYASLRVR